LQAVPPPAGTDPLAVATTREECTADEQVAAAPLLAALRAYITAYEAKSALPDVPFNTIAAHAATADPSIPYYLEIRPNLGRPAGPVADSGGVPGRRGRGGGLGGGGPRGEGGGPGGPGPEGGPVIVGPPDAAANGANPPTQAQRDAFRNSPAFKAFRGFTQCTYVTVLASSEAKAKGIDTSSGRPRLLYVPTIGFVYVRPPELPQGGGSLNQTQ
jgi:hypothetical protein